MDQSNNTKSKLIHMMKKLLVVAMFVASAGTLYGAYVWANSVDTDAESSVTLCSIAQDELQDADRALDKVIPVTWKSSSSASSTVSLPLRAWGRSYPDSTNRNVMALVKEADFQLDRRKNALKNRKRFCFAKD